MTLNLTLSRDPQADLEGWRQHGLCFDSADPAFFPEQGRTSAERAKAICAECPVSEPCLDWALRANERFGIWGGTTTKERYAIKRRRREVA